MLTALYLHVMDLAASRVRGLGLVQQESPVTDNKMLLSSQGLASTEKADSISGECVSLCKQCGTCSGSCPNVAEMDLSPRQVMHLAQLGQMERVLNSRTIWVCSACLQCSARCPRGIDIARVMESFRSVQLRSRSGRLDPSQIMDPACLDAPPILIVGAMRKLTG